MWNIEYKPDHNSEVWIILESFEDMMSACNHASLVSSEYYKIKVTGEDGSAIWSTSWMSHMK